MVKVQECENVGAYGHLSQFSIHRLSLPSDEMSKETVAGVYTFDKKFKEAICLSINGSSSPCMPCLEVLPSA